MMNNSLFPESKLEMSSKSLGLESISSEKKMNFKLFHVQKMNVRKQSKEKYHVDEEMSLVQHFKNKGILQSITKPQRKQHKLMRIKSSLQESISYLAIHELDEHTKARSFKRREKMLTMSNKRFSTTCTNNQESQSPEAIESPQRLYLVDQLKQTKNLQAGGVGIRVVRRKRKVTINQFLEQKNRKVREYEYSKLSRTDIIPNFLAYSKKHSKNQEIRLIKNISERVYPTYKLSPNFEALQY